MSVYSSIWELMIINDGNKPYITHANRSLSYKLSGWLIKFDTVYLIGKVKKLAGCILEGMLEISDSPE